MAGPSRQCSPLRRAETVRSSVCEVGACGWWWLVLAGVAVSEVDLQRGAWGAPGAVALPLGVGLDDGLVDQLGRGLLVGEVAAGLDRLADLAVQALDRVGGVDGLAQLLGQRQERCDVLPRVAPRAHGRRIALAPVFVEALEL